MPIMEAYERYNRGHLLHDRYLKVEDISEGSYGLVSLAKDTQNDNRLVAVKYIYPPDYERAKHYKELLKKTGRATSSPAKLRSNVIETSLRERTSVLVALNEMSSKEIRIHQILGEHPHVTSLVDHFDTCLVLEYCSRGDLYEAIQSDTGPSTSQDIKDVFLQILSALNYCHLRLVYHRDLKPENILITADWLIKLCDWGLATTTRIITNRTEFDIGSERYMAPELFDTEATSYDAEKVDLWAVGIILLTLVFHKNPFQVANYTDKRFLQFSGNREALFDFFSAMSGELFAVLRFLLTIDPENRDLSALTREVEALRYFTMDEEYWAEHSDDDTGYEEDDDKIKKTIKDDLDDEMFMFDRGPAIEVTEKRSEVQYANGIDKEQKIEKFDALDDKFDKFNDRNGDKFADKFNDHNGGKFDDTFNSHNGNNHDDKFDETSNGHNGDNHDDKFDTDKLEDTKFNNKSPDDYSRHDAYESKTDTDYADKDEDRLLELYDMPYNRRADALLGEGVRPIPIGGRIRNTRKPFGVASYNKNGRPNTSSAGTRFRREDFFTPRSVAGHYMDKYGESREQLVGEKKRKWNRGRKKQSWKKKPERKQRMRRRGDASQSNSTQGPENREGRDFKSDTRDFKNDFRDFKERGDFRGDSRDFRDSRDYRDSRDKDRDVRDSMRELLRETRDSHARDMYPFAPFSFRRLRVRSPRSPRVAALTEDLDALALPDGEVFQLDFDEPDRQSAHSYGSPSSYGSHFARRNLDAQGKYVPPNRRGSAGMREKRRSVQYASINQRLEELDLWLKE